MISAKPRSAASDRMRLLGWLSCILLIARPALATLAEETIASPQWTIHLVHPQDAPKGLVLYLPSARGWDPAAASRARELADQGHLIAGIDWRPPTPERTPAPDQAGQPPSCLDLGEDLTRLAQWLGQRETLPKDALPILLGESEGAALIYGALLQSPRRRFHAAVTLDFCPRWPVAQPPCRRAELTDESLTGDRFRPAARVPNAWFAFTDAADPACPAGATAAFVTQVGNARLATGAPGAPPAQTAGEALSPLASIFQWLDPRIPDQVGVVSAQADTAGLPLVEVRAPQEDPSTFAVMLSGDGGWAALDRGLSARLAAAGISTVGWDSLSYFWTARSPAESARDLARVIRHYLEAWHKERVILMGFSYGAEVLPFMVNGLPDDVRPRVTLAILLSVGRTAMFQFHLSDWFDVGRGADARPVLPQVQALAWTQRLCIYGEDDANSLCPDLTGQGVEVKKVPGNHHFDEDYPGVANLILEAARPRAPALGSAASAP